MQLTQVGTAQIGHSLPRQRVPGGEEGISKTEEKIGWLVGGKEGRQQEKESSYMGFREGKEEIVGEGKLRCPLELLEGSLLVPTYFSNTDSEALNFHKHQ